MNNNDNQAILHQIKNQANIQFKPKNKLLQLLLQSQNERQQSPLESNTNYLDNRNEDISSKYCKKLSSTNQQAKSTKIFKQKQQKQIYCNQQNQQELDGNNQIQKSQASELQSLLKTNRILIGNKRNIQQQKIRTYTSKTIKIKKLISQTFQRQEKQQLLAKLKLTEIKKKQSEIKLQKLNKIQIQMSEAKTNSKFFNDITEQNNGSNNNYQSDKEEWRIIKAKNKKDHSQYSQCQYLDAIFQNKNSQFMKSRCFSLQNQGNCNKNKIINNGQSQINTLQESCSNNLNSKFTPFLLQKSQDKTINIKKSLNNTLYDNLNSLSAQKQKRSFIKSINMNSSHKKQTKQSPKSRIKINQFMQNCNPLKLQQNNKYIEHIFSIMQEIYTILDYDYKTNSNLHTKLNYIATNPKVNIGQFYQIVSEMLSNIHCIISTKGQHQQKQKQTIKQHLQLELNQIINRQRNILEQIDELSLLKQQLVSNTIDQLDKNSQNFQSIIDYASTECVSSAKNTVYNFNVKKHQQIWDDKNQQLPELRSSVDKFISKFDNMTQTCNLKLLESTQKRLAIQYKISNIGYQQADHRKLLSDLNQTIQKQQQILSKMTRQVDSQRKQNNKLQSNKKILQEQIQQLEDLYQIRKSGSTQMQNKYNLLKSKKSKLDKTLKVLNQTILAAQNNQKLLQSKINQKQSYLKEYLQLEIKQQQKNKENIIKQVQNKIQQLEVAQQQLNIIIGKTNDFKKILKTQEKQAKKMNTIKQQIERQLEEQSQKLSELIVQIDQKQSQQIQRVNQLKQSIQIKQKKLQSLINSLENKEKQLKEISQALQKKQNKKTSLGIQINKLETKITQLTIQGDNFQKAKDQLEEILSQILQKKQTIIQDLQNKYSEFTQLQLQCQQYHHQLSTHAYDITQKQTYLSKISQTLQQIQQQIITKNNNLQNINSKLNTTNSNIALYAGEQENIQERIKALKKIQARILICSTVKNDIPELMSELEEQSLKQRVQEILSKIEQNSLLYQKLMKQKQQNRKLKLDNDRLLKMHQIDDKIFQ